MMSKPPYFNLTLLYTKPDFKPHTVQVLPLISCHLSNQITHSRSASSTTTTPTWKSILPLLRPCLLTRDRIPTL